MISMNKYNLLMEHVNPSPDLEQRLHDAGVRALAVIVLKAVHVPSLPLLN